MIEELRRTEFTRPPASLFRRHPMTVATASTSNRMTALPKVNGIPTGWRAEMLSLVGGPIARRLAKWGKVLEEIAAFEPELKKETDRELKKRSLSLRYRAKAGEPLARLVPEGYALVREAAVRTINQRHYDVQMIGGMALFNGCIA